MSHPLHHRPGVRRSASALATPDTSPYDWVDEGKLLLFATERVVNRAPRTGPRLVTERKRKRGSRRERKETAEDAKGAAAQQLIAEQAAADRSAAADADADTVNDGNN
jgi:hypothetical protein